jgi:hypothetical protein
VSRGTRAACRQSTAKFVSRNISDIERCPSEDGLPDLLRLLEGSIENEVAIRRPNRRPQIAADKCNHRMVSAINRLRQMSFVSLNSLNFAALRFPFQLFLPFGDFVWGETAPSGNRDDARVRLIGGASVLDSVWRSDLFVGS